MKKTLIIVVENSLSKIYRDSKLKITGNHPALLGFPGMIAGRPRMSKDLKISHQCAHVAI